MSRGNKTKSFLFNFTIIFLLILLLLLILGIVREYLRQKELDAEVAALQLEIEKLNLDKRGFLDSIEAYQSEFFLEQEARTKFNLQKPGEKVAIIPSSTISSITTDSNASLGTSNLQSNNVYIQNIKAWWQYFFAAES